MTHPFPPHLTQAYLHQQQEEYDRRSRGHSAVYDRERPARHWAVTAACGLLLARVGVAAHLWSFRRARTSKRPVRLRGRQSRRLTMSDQNVEATRWITEFFMDLSSSCHPALMKMNANTDVADVPPMVRVPSAVLHRTGNAAMRVGNGRYVSEHTPGSRDELPGQDRCFGVGDSGVLLDEIAEFLRGERSVHHCDRVLTTIMFTDIVASTEQPIRLGDALWRRRLDQHDHLTRREVVRWGGRFIKSTGDGALATFDSPTRAIRCAVELQKALSAEDLAIRAGLHSGEIELRNNDVGGVGVHIASRVQGLAAPDEVLVTKTVTELVAGSGITFVDRGFHDLKGITGNRQVCAVANI
jgi:class 3 adenylate cyclase